MEFARFALIVFMGYSLTKSRMMWRILPSGLCPM
ncbi:MAG: hypothetical protein R2860_06900 [Desulfobacterales bacterium]